MTDEPIVSAHKNIVVLSNELDAACTRLVEADKACKEADGERTAALNGINLAQANIDEWYELQKKDAPTASDWAHKWGKPEGD